MLRRQRYIFRSASPFVALYLIIGAQCPSGNLRDCYYVSTPTVQRIFFAFIAFVSASDVLITESGLKLPIHVIRKNLLSVPEHQLGDAIFEHRDAKILVSKSLRLDVRSIAQDVEMLSPNSSVILTVNGQSATSLTGGPSFRKGNGYTFVYSNDGKEEELIAAWVNGITLYPLHRNAQVSSLTLHKTI